MHLFEKLTREKDNIIMASLLNEKTNFSKLRKLASKFSKQNEVDLKTDGTDEKLWKAIMGYFRGLSKKSR